MTSKFQSWDIPGSLSLPGGKDHLLCKMPSGAFAFLPTTCLDVLLERGTQIAETRTKRAAIALASLAGLRPGSSLDVREIAS